MKMDSHKTCEMLKIYSKAFSLSIESGKSLYETFSEIIKNGETNLNLDDYNVMLLIKDYFS